VLLQGVPLGCDHMRQQSNDVPNARLSVGLSAFPPCLGASPQTFAHLYVGKKLDPRAHTDARPSMCTPGT
jgi:hypothetical protein